MYYDANGADYIQTPSFAIPNTGILTVEAWMKSKIKSTTQSVLCDGNQNGTVGYIFTYREPNTYHLGSNYAKGDRAMQAIFSNFFTDVENQWVHAVVLYDYTNKTLKAYKNGIQFGATQNLIGTPVFPSTSRIKTIGAYDSGQLKIADGSLDEVRIYNRGLSASEIASIYNQTKGRY